MKNHLNIDVVIDNKVMALTNKRYRYTIYIEFEINLKE